MRSFVYFLTFLLISACLISCQPIRLDPIVIGAIDAGYPTLEFEACGKLWLGMGVCRIAPGQSYSSLNINLQGYYQGTVQIQSEACNVSILRRYVQNELISVPTPSTATTDCLFTFQIFPEYPHEANTSISVSGFKGMLWVRMIPKAQAWKPALVRHSGHWVQNLSLYSGGTGPVKVTAVGCNRDLASGPFLLSNGYLNFPLQNYVSPMDSECVLEGLVINPQFKNLLFSVLVAQYSVSFAPLPIPVATVSNGFLEVNADPAVSVISLDDDYKINNKTSFQFDASQPHILRTLTTKGRSVLGQWNPKKGTWSWLQ